MKAAEFMRGRYGNDKLNTLIWIVAGVLYIVNLFVGSPILMIVVLVLIALAVVRALSTNVTKRLYENNRFVSFYTVIFDFFKRQFMKVKDFKTHRYIRCPHCKAQLRLKKRTGVQHIHCPRCNQDFKKNILF